MSNRYFVIDAFTAEKYAGNPAAIVLDADDLDTAAMQAVASEFNLGITTYTLRPQLHHGDAPAIRVRWFTPAAEVRMCGHGTIAALQALVECGAIPRPDPSQSTVLKIECAAGVLDGYVESMPGAGAALMFWLDLPDPMWRRIDFDRPQWATWMGGNEGIWDTELPTVRTQDNDLLTFVRDFGVLNGLRPDLARIAEYSREKGVRGVCVSTVRTVTPSVHVQSRFFAPSIGLAEDIVTGSVHGPLPAYLVDCGMIQKQGDLAALTCVQGIAGGRAGMLNTLVQSRPNGAYGVRIGARAVVSMSGALAS